ncbi:RNA-binding protein 48 [Fasciola gigantica]|uniref:RNA-binding protein 48 n=1 Tax=Fasciola gigantica TaxID=46835 RepID=A0A504YQA9_FASGI|nr:RNA-binding protein 48 [Fasciola gigantica]
MKAKRKLDDSSFYGGSLHVCYAPEYETVAETRVKLYTCRRDNGRIARKAEYEYSQRLLGSTSSDLNSLSNNDTPSVTTVPGTDVSYTDTDVSQSPPTASASTYEHPANFGSGDARDDARRYWLERGMDWMQLGAAPPVQNEPSPTCVSMNSVGRPRLEPCMGPNGKPLPLPVLQALSWRPYRAPVREPQPDKSTRSRPPLLPDKSSTSATPSAFVPRCLRVHFTPSVKQSTKPSDRTNDQRTSAQKEITVGELKRLAFTLGPRQGPSLPPVLTRQSTGYKRAACDTKRIIFRDRQKRQRIERDNETNKSNSS